MSGSAWRLAIAVLIASATLAANASAAVRPACYAESKQAFAKRPSSKPLPPLAIGDSIMKPSVPQLGKAGWDADARVCRSFIDARRMIRVRKTHRTLPRVVVIALGGNGPFTVEDIAKVVHMMGKSRRLGLLTARFSVDRPGYGAEAIHEAAARYPKIVRVLDWVALARNKPQWFDQDGVHLDTKAGVRAYTNLIRSAYRRSDVRLGGGGAKTR
jgi:hypothetical protein